jgi:hypothetical protein
MAFDEKLAGRIRNQLGKKKGLSEKKMFGGIAAQVREMPVQHATEAAL